MKWNSLVCLVTGASSGFGRRACIEFAAKGATVIAVARRQDKLESLIEELGGKPHSFRVADISKLDEVRKLAAEVSASVGHIDVLVNNAGVSTAGSLSKATSEEMERVIRTNLLGSMWCTKELLPLLTAAPVAERTPVIVNVASMAGRIPTPGAADYTASKFGLVAFTEGIWAELKELGVRVMMLNPGFAETEGFPMNHIRSSGNGWAVMDATRVMKAAIRGIERGAFEVRVQWWMHPLYHLTVLLGPLRRRITSSARSSVGGLGGD